MAQRFADKVTVITGTGSGQGREAALAFASEGAKVVGCDLNEKGAAETVDLVTSAGGEMQSLHPLDLSDEQEVVRLIDHAEHTYGGLDILYNNAGALRPGGVVQDRADFEYTIANEVTIVWMAARQAIEAFRRRGSGVMINVGSVSGMMGAGFVGNAPGLFSHAIAKSGVIRMTELLAIELADIGVRVNSISPGIIETEATSPLLGADGSEVRRHFLDMILIRRIGRPRDVVNAAMFLASDDASYITGANLVVDGGWVASGQLGTPSAQVLGALQQGATA